MTPEQIEAKAQELYPGRSREAIQMRKAYRIALESRQPEIDQLKERVKELAAFVTDLAGGLYHISPNGQDKAKQLLTKNKQQ